MRRIADRLFCRKGAAHEALLKRLALNVLHDQEIDAILMTDVMQSADIGMRQLRNGARFALQPLSQRRIRRKTRRKDFDSDRAI